MEGVYKEAPVGVKVVSILYFIGAVFIFLAGLFSMSLFSVAGLRSIGGGLSLVIIAFFIGFASLYFFIGRGLWKGQVWSRVVVVIFSVLGVLGGLSQLIGGAASGVVGIVVSGLIGGYFIFNQKVGEFFA